MRPRTWTCDEGEADPALVGGRRIWTGLAGATGLAFLAARDLRSDGLERLDSAVSCVRYYRVTKSGPPLFMICYLGPNDELADVDLLWQ